MNQITKKKTRRSISILFHVFFVFLIMIGGVVIFHNLYFTPIKIVGSSMLPTLKDSDFGVMDTHDWSLNKLERFDIIIVQRTSNVEKYIIKRIIGLPGEQIVFDGNGTLFVNNKIIQQDFLPYTTHQKLTCTLPTYLACYDSITLQEDEYYVLGDNRGASSDSRVLGTFNKQQIIGKLFAIEGVCHASSSSNGEIGVDFDACSNRSYHWPIFF
jgi:signal peptidase I